MAGKGKATSIARALKGAVLKVRVIEGTGGAKLTGGKPAQYRARKKGPRGKGGSGGKAKRSRKKK